MNREVKTLKPHISINVRNVKESVEFYKRCSAFSPQR